MLAVKRLVAICLVVTLLSTGLEFASDYSDVFEGTDLAAMPSGHDSNDGHDPAEHQIGCDICHFGGVHLMGVAMASPADVRMPPAADSPWQMPPPGAWIPHPPTQPPIA